LLEVVRVRQIAGIVIHKPASAYVRVAVISDDLDFGIIRDTEKSNKGNKIPPIVIAIISAENTQPVGSPPGGSQLSNVGAHINTKVYIAP
jgi:hypothetical protein